MNNRVAPQLRILDTRFHIRRVNHKYHNKKTVDRTRGVKYNTTEWKNLYLFGN